MSDNLAIVHYELYVLETRGWMLHARYPRQQKDKAISEARTAESALGTGVKVMRETYFPSTNNCNEEVIYVTPKYAAVANAPPAVAAKAFKPNRPASAGGSWMDEAATAANTKNRKRSSAQQLKREADNAISLVIKILLIMVGSTLVAGFAAAITATVANNMASVGMSFGGGNGLTFAVFVVVFLLTALPLAATFINIDPQPVAPAKGSAKSSAGQKSFDERNPLPLPLSWLLGIFDDDTPKKKQLSGRPKPSDTSADDAAPDSADRPESEDPTSDSDLEETDTKDEQPDDDDEKSENSSDAVDKNRMELMKFLSGAVNALKATRPQLDKSGKFAFHLYLAGAAEVLADRKGLGESAVRDLMAETMRMFGTKAEMAQMFVDKYEEYLMVPSNLLMIQAGRASMTKIQDGDTSTGVFKDLTKALTDWEKPNSGKPSGPQISTIIFTDMVGSTDLTQKLGDEGAQEVVRRHNSLVRNALREFSGKEVKHTGDGIMASFASATNAVEGCMAIQRAVMSHNLNMPNLEMHLRIGMNAGEPIQEEDDFFGTTVQLSARVCAQADSEQIFCTAVIKDLSAGKPYEFRPMGDHSMKGFQNKITLYEVVWR